MPRLNSKFERAPFFLYGKDPRSGKTSGPVGTGFFVAVEFGQYRTHNHIYAVTCHHLAPQGASIIRINTKNGLSRMIEFEPHEWQFVPGGPDVAAIDVTDRIDFETTQATAIPLHMMVRKDDIEHAEIRIGEDGFMLGLLTGLDTGKRNKVSGRFGNLAMVADPDVLIEHNSGSHPMHLFDIRTRAGFSGSPVFIYRTPSGDLRNVSYGRRPKTVRPARRDDESRQSRAHDSYNEEDYVEFDTDNNLFVKLLGVHAGQYSETIQVRKAKPTIHTQADDSIRDGDKLSFASGMTVVVPSWDIESLLALPAFENQRRTRIMEKKVSDDACPVPQSATHGADSVKPDAPNTQHQEDFKSLVSAAAKKKPQAD